MLHTGTFIVEGLPHMSTLATKDGYLGLAFVEGHIDVDLVTEEWVLAAVLRDFPWIDDPDEIEEFLVQPVAQFFLTMHGPEGSSPAPGKQWQCSGNDVGARPVTGVIGAVVGVPPFSPRSI